MNTSNRFITFFDDDWQTMLEAVEIPGMDNPSWDRKAAYLYFNKEGTTTMAPRKKAQNGVALVLQDALKMLAYGQQASGNQQANHVYIANGRATTFNGIIAVCVPLPGVDWEAYPHTKLLGEALANVGKELELAVQDDGSLSLSSGDYEAIIPAGDRAQMVPVSGDPMQGQLGEGFTQALELAARIISDSAENFRDAAIHLEGPRFLATNGMVLVEVNHGIPMPPSVVANMPKAFSNALAKCGKKLVGLGIGIETVTAYLEDGSFIRSQLYREMYPGDVANMLEQLAAAPTLMDPPKGLIEAINAVAPFAHDGAVEFAAGKVAARSVDKTEWTATKDVAGVPDGVVIPGKFLTLYPELVKVWFGDPNAPTPRVVAHGQNFRVVIAGSAPLPRPVADAPPATQQAGNGGWGQPAPAWAPPQDGSQPSPQSGGGAAQQPAPASAWGAAAPLPDAATPAPSAASVQPPNGSGPATTSGSSWDTPTGQQPNAPAPAQQAMTATYPSNQQPPPPFLAAGPITLPYTPRSRRWQDPDNPGWNTYPYTLQPGETVEQFAAEAPYNPTQPGPGTSGGATYAAQVAQPPATTHTSPMPTVTTVGQLEVPWGQAPGTGPTGWGQPQ